MSEFRLALESNGLFDLGRKGMKHTWNNRHSDATFTKIRLDRAIATKDWIEKIGNQKTKFLSSDRLDHQPILISTFEPTVTENKKAKLFIFEATWIKHDMEEQVIQEAWTISTSTMNSWKQIQVKTVQSCSYQVE